MTNLYRFYTYAYLREDRTPYYIGKGTKNRAYKKYKGEVNPPKDKSRIIFLKQNLTEEEAFEHEIYMIAVLGRKDLGTGILRNKTNGGDGISGFKHSEKSKNEMSENRRGENNSFYGKTHSLKTKRLLSQLNKGKQSPMLGKSLSPEARKKISESRKGKYDGSKNHMFGKTHSQETKNKISKANFGKRRTEEERKQMSENRRGENNSFYGKTHSQESIRKMSEIKKGKICQEEHKKKISSAHNKFLRFMSPFGEIIEEITTLRKFCEKYNLSRDGMSRVMKGEQQQSKGWSMPPEELAHGDLTRSLFVV